VTLNTPATRTNGQTILLRGTKISMSSSSKRFLIRRSSSRRAANILSGGVLTIAEITTPYSVNLLTPITTGSSVTQEPDGV